MIEGIVSAIQRALYQDLGSIPFLAKVEWHNSTHAGQVEKLASTDYHQLLYLRNGQLQFRFLREDYVLERGQFLLLHPRQEAFVSSLEAPADWLSLPFAFCSVHPFPGQNFQANPEIQFVHLLERGQEERMALPPIFVLPDRAQATLLPCVERIANTERQSPHGAELSRQLLTLDLLLQMERVLLAEWEASRQVRGGNVKELIQLSRKYILENYHKEITVADVASNIYLSPGYFARIFRDVCGMSPMGYILQVRVAKACKLLEEMDYKVNVVALQVGFASPQRFNSAFRKQMGMTPVDYRRMCVERQKRRAEEALRPLPFRIDLAKAFGEL